MLKKVLLLDDDPMIHELVKPILADLCLLFHAYNADEANKTLEKENINLFICDLFLEGDSGDELSNDVIRMNVIPRGIPYCRLTSAPRLVPIDCEGLGVIDKREVFYNKKILVEFLLKI